MPDIKSALEKALAQTANAWAADDEAHQQMQKQEKPMTISVSTIDHTPSSTAEVKKDGHVTNNVSRTTFEYIRDNPGLTIEQVTSRLVAQGFKENSVSSLCYQMIRVRLVVADANGKLTAVVQQYAPIQTTKRRRKVKVVKASVPTPAKPERKQVTLINTRTGEIINPKPTPAPAPEPLEKEWEPNDVIDKLTVHQAIALFKALRSVLVG
jgi:hypothetical protein